MIVSLWFNAFKPYNNHTVVTFGSIYKTNYVNYILTTLSIVVATIVRRVVWVDRSIDP